MKEAALPLEFAALQGRVFYIQRISDNEFAGSCPYCSGNMHPNGESPDRFRMWIKSRATGNPIGWCRNCGRTWSPHGEKLDPIQHQNWVKERQEAEQERLRSAERALENLRREQAWVRYHAQVGEVRQMYHARGITDEWIDYWMLGYNPSKEVWDNGEVYTTACLTIPIFLPGQAEPITIRNRLLSPRRDNDKYRPEYAGLPSSLFYTNRDTKPKERCMVLEGEFKSMTTYLVLDDPKIFVVGTPGKTPSPELLKSQLGECDEVYLCLDPDAYACEGKNKTSPIRKMIDVFGNKSRVIQLPGKIDDLITTGYLDKHNLHTLIRGARRIKL